jgi:hypothetical protein
LVNVGDEEKIVGLTNYPNGGQYSQQVRNDELGVESRADVHDGVTHIEAMGCWLTRVMVECTSSEEKTEKRKDREETHVAVG